MYKCDKFQLPATFNNYFKLITDIYPHNTKQTKTRQLVFAKTLSNSGVKMLRYNHGRRKGGRGASAPHWILKFSAKKVVFLVLRGKNQISPLLRPSWKNPLVPPLGKNPSDAHGYNALEIWSDTNSFRDKTHYV